MLNSWKEKLGKQTDQVLQSGQREESQLTWAIQTSSPEKIANVSVVTPIFNGEQDIPPLVQCFFTQSYPKIAVEFLLVDNASKDRTSTLIKQSCQDAELAGIQLKGVEEFAIQGPSAARNAGIQASSAEIIAFTDVDCRPAPDWLEKLVIPFQDPEVGLVIGEVEALPGDSLMEKYAARKQILSQQKTLIHPHGPFGAAANFAIRRKVFEQIGLFRPYLTTGEDADLCWRIHHQTSWRTYYQPEARVYHRHRSSLKAFHKQFVNYGRGHKYLSELHGVDPTPDWKIHHYAYHLIRWVLKELPLNLTKVAQQKADPIELWVPPIYLISRHALSKGQREAVLPENAVEIARIYRQTI